MMANRISQPFVSRAILASVIVFIVGGVVAQSPYELPSGATDTELQEVVVPLSDAVKRKIAEALARDAQQDEPSGSTGDPILDDVLNVIRRQGSVLDGSSLDPQSTKPNDDIHQNQIDPAQLSIPGEPTALYPSDSRNALDGPDARFHVAESLLRAARELGALPGRDQQRNRLIAAMREQATVLMIDEFSQTASESP